MQLATLQSLHADTRRVRRGGPKWGCMCRLIGSKSGWEGRDWKCSHISESALCSTPPVCNYHAGRASLHFGDDVTQYRTKHWGWIQLSTDVLNVISLKPTTTYEIIFQSFWRSYFYSWNTIVEHIPYNYSS